MTLNYYNNQYGNQQPQQSYYTSGIPQSQSPYQMAQQPVERRLRYSDERRSYIGGYDPGSGYAELWVAPEDDLEKVARAIIPSWVSLMSLAEIGKRSRLLGADPVDELEEDEFVIEVGGIERGAGRLGRDGGTNRTNALNDPRRYSNEHSLSLLFALCGRLIPEDKFTLRFVTGLPVSLFHHDNRLRVQDALTRTFHFTWNGQPKNGLFVCGAVVAEGAGGLMLYGDTSSKTLVIDYGKRTTDVLIANGQKVDITRSKGFSIGVSHLIDAFNEEFFKIAKRRLDDNEAEMLVCSYADGKSLPEVKSQRRVIDSTKIKAILDDVYERIGQQSNTKIAAIINEDSSGELAAEFEVVIPIGGGAFHFKRALEKLIPNIEAVRKPQSANPEGYFEIAISFDDAVWQKVVKNVENRRDGTGGA